RHAFGPAGNHLGQAELDRLAAVVGIVEFGAVQQLATVVHAHDILARRARAAAGALDAVLQAAVGDAHALAFLVALEEGIALFQVAGGAGGELGRLPGLQLGGVGVLDDPHLLVVQLRRLAGETGRHRLGQHLDVEVVLDRHQRVGDIQADHVTDLVAFGLQAFDAGHGRAAIGGGGIGGGRIGAGLDLTGTVVGGFGAVLITAAGKGEDQAGQRQRRGETQGGLHGYLTPSVRAGVARRAVLSRPAAATATTGVANRPWRSAVPAQDCGGGSASCCSIAATSAGSSGCTRCPKLATTRPWRSIRYLWKFQPGDSPVASASCRYSAVAPSPRTCTFSNIGNFTP